MREHCYCVPYTLTKLHELSRSAEPNADSIECINLIESVRLKKCDGTPL